MKKSIFSALCLVLLATTTQSAWGEGCADFSTLQENTSYGKRTTTAGWISTYSAVESFDSATGVKLNGKTSAQGVLSSPTLANGCGTLTFSYGSANDTKIGFTISIKDASDVEVYNSGSDYASLTITKNTVYTFSKAINCSGNFTIKISNASPSNSTKNANRLNISKLCWTSYSGTTPTTLYSVQFDAGSNGTCGTTELTEASAGAGVTLPDCTPNEGYTFIGWATTDGSSTADAGKTGDNYKPTDNCTLYAVYKASTITTYTVNFYVEGALKESRPQTTAGAAITLPTYAGCGDYTFAGWSTTDNHSNAPNVTGSTYTPTANIDLYAVYSKTEGSGGSSTGTYNFADMDNFSDWGTSYSQHTHTFSDGAFVDLASANHSTATIDNMPVSKGGNVIFKAPTGSTISALTFTCKQWTTKTQTITLHTSTDGENYTKTSTTSSNFTLTANGLSNVVAVKFTFSSSSNQVGYNSLSVTYSGGSTTTYTTRPGCDCTAPSTPLNISAAATALNLDKDGNASTTLSTTGGNGGTVAYSVSPNDGASISADGKTFTATKAGTYTVKATQEKNDFCSQQASVEIEVKATPIVTLTAVTPITLTADCGQKATATVQVTAYNCGTNDVKITSSDTRVTVNPSSLDPDAAGKVNDVVTLSYTASKGDDESFSATISAKCGTTAGKNTISVTATKGNCTPSVLTFIDRGSQYKQINSHYAGEQLAASEVPVPTGVCTQPVEYIFDGWATAKVDNGATSYEKVDFPYTINGDATLYAVYKWVDAGGGDGNYHLVTTAPADWSGEYLIVSGTKAFDGSLTDIDVADNNFDVTITSNTIASSSDTEAKNFTIAKNDEFYTIKSKSGKYIGATASGKLNAATTVANDKLHTLSIGSPNSKAVIVPNKGTTANLVLQTNGGRFRYYTSSQSAVYLYRKEAGTTYYTSSPACGPYVQIVGSKDIYVTSGNVGGRSTVQAQDTIRFTSGALKDDGGKAPRIKIESTDITNGGAPTTIVEVAFVDSICTKNGDGTYSITGGIVVRYTPTNIDAKEDIKVKLRAEYNTGKNVVLDSFMVHARSLPEKFVITAKGTDGKWYALPADMSGSNTYAGNGQLVVDNAANPAKATVTPCNTIYTFDGQKNTTDSVLMRYVRFVGLGGKYLWAATSGNTGIQDTGSESAATADSKPYNWLLTSADNVTYTFANQNTDRTLRLSGTNFGMYTSGVNELRILPIVEADTCAYNAAPQNISLLSRTSTTVTLAWAAVPGAERYQYNVGTIWNDCTVDDLDYPQATITGLGTGATVTIALRAVHGTAEKICSDTAQITVTTANCDDVPTISGTINGGSSCGTLTLTATGVTASSDALCPITQYGFQYTQDTTTWATYEQTEHSSLPVSSSINDPVTVSRGGKYYVRLYAVNEVGTGYSAVKTIDVSGLANLQIITAGDATTAPMISGKATLRIGAVSDSPSPITWQVFDGSNAEQTTIADGIANNGVFSTTAFGVYRVVAKQAANAAPTYCADSATIYIEVRLPNHYGYVTNCAVLNNNNLEVINVSKDNITFGIDDADVVQIEIVKENTGNTSTGGGGQAEDLFFSKYYESIGTSKLLAIYNGTNSVIDLSDVYIHHRNASSFCLAQFGHTEAGKIYPQEELIFMAKGDTGVDTCAQKEPTFIAGKWYHNNGSKSDVVYKPDSTTMTVTGYGLTLDFGGKGTVWLERGSKMIDVIGRSDIVDGTQSSPYGDNGFVCSSGDDLYTEDTEETDYPLSTARCLLVRKNTVTSGANAVAQNTSTFATLCTEWMGHGLSKHDADNGVQASCDGMAYVGSFDYAEYFQRYEPVTGKIELVNLNHNADGSWSLNTGSFAGTAWDGKNFHDLACTSVKINGYQKSGGKDSLTTALNYKVPIIVDRTTTTEDADLFGFAGEGRLICPECDVVIRDNQKLSVVPAGYNNIRDMWVYSGAALNIQDDKTYNMGKLTIESENNEVGYALIKGTLNAQDGISHTKRIDANAWYDFSLPYNCKVSDIVRTNGKTLGTYGTDWIIKYYDGQKRAISGTPNGAAPTNWAVVPADGILEAGVGYIVALGGIHNANPNYKVRFVLPNRSTQPYVESISSNVKKGVKGYTGPKAEELPCHKGWNYLGNPYVSRFDGALQDDPVWQTAYTGLLLNGFYTDLLTGNSYDVIEYPDLYVAVDMGEGGATNWVQTKASEALLSPFRAFMIQAVSDGDVDFNKDARNLPQGQAPSIRSVSAEREIVNAVRLNISHDTYGTGSTDIMLHSLYTDKYDLGYDMVRMFNSRPAAQPFTLNSTADYLLYNAANRDLAETSDIPVGIRTLAAGTYTFSLAPLTGTDRYAAIYLIDRDENDLKIDLLQGNYTTMLARETNTSRFALRFEKGAQLPTDIDNDAIQSPIIYRDQTDIVIDNLPTDATVRVVDAIGRTLYMQQADAQIVRFHAPARGAYIIQVMTQQGNFSIKTIL